jgi:hypothetical protein
VGTETDPSYEVLPTPYQHIQPTEKRCRGRCRRNLSLDEYHRHPNGLYGRHPRCKRCRRDEQAWRSSTDHRANHLMRKYGITLADYERLLAVQGGVCAICRTDRTSRWGTLCVDHDHESKHVRGLLCTDCNLAVGKMRDDADLFRRAAAYLEA